MIKNYPSDASIQGHSPYRPSFGDRDSVPNGVSRDRETEKQSSIDPDSSGNTELERSINVGVEQVQPSSLFSCGDLTHTMLNPITETELAGWLRMGGHRVVLSHGRYWREIARGFFQPVHWLAQLSAAEFRRPSPLCWGFRACLNAENTSATNARIPVHVLENLQDYELVRLNRDLRKKIQKCRREAEVVEIKNVELLREQGYGVVVSALKRAAYREIPNREEYLSTLHNYLQPGRLVLAILMNGELQAYASGFAIDGTAYCEEQYIADRALPVCAGAGLIYEFVTICRRSPGIRRIVNGLHSREDSGLCRFKASVGFSVHFVPAMASILAPFAALLRYVRPHKYYRLTGRG